MAKQFIVNLNDFFFVSYQPLIEDMLVALGCTMFDSYEEMIEYVSETQGYSAEEVEGLEVEIENNSWSYEDSEPVDIDGEIEVFVAQFDENLSE